MREKKAGERRFQTNSRRREMEKNIDKKAMERFKTPSFQEIAEELKRKGK